ncbi:MAG TPA: hypothetical protein VH333_04750 [Pseudonocardiaceae bacterium]|nr:hypothetical protein [Pseudonocardiaceae bacterium]
MDGLEIDGDGARPAVWRRAAHAPDQLPNPRRLRGIAAAVENSGFTLATLDDDLLPPGQHPNPVGRIGAVERAAFIAAATSTLGIVPVVSTTYAEPFLHTSAANISAIRLYESLGFTPRRRLTFLLLRVPQRH